MKSEFYVVARYVRSLAVVAIALNWLWEMLQMPAYVEMVGPDWGNTAWRCTGATLGDVATTLGICLAGALSAGTPRWAHRPSWSTWAAASFMGVMIQSIYRRLKENRQLPVDLRQSPFKVVYAASCEVRNSSVYATLPLGRTGVTRLRHQVRPA
ncbi:MAG: hypothetical protein SGJ19_05690 [Planctomycetia bacterium]|nr:hypothetical protein [Planctomycetia bacterium]